MSVFRALGARPAGEEVAPTASVALHPTDQELEALLDEDQARVRGEAVVRLFSAARLLKDANLALSEALQRALEWLFGGVLLLVVALLAYTLV